MFSHCQNFLNDMNNKWCEGKHSPTISKVSTKEKPLRLLNSEEFSKFMLPIIRHNIAHLGNVADLGNWSGLQTIEKSIFEIEVRERIRKIPLRLKIQS